MSEVNTVAASATADHQGQTEKSAHPVQLLIRAVMLENLRRREFYVVLILMGLFLLGALVAKLVSPPLDKMPAGVAEATGSFLLNMGLTLVSVSAHVLTLLAAARQFPDELERRTIYPLLAKPLGRGQFLIGKWAAAWLTGISTLLVLLPVALLPAWAAAPTSAALFMEAILLQFASLAVLSALVILGSLLMPKALNIVIGALVVWAGGTIINLLRAHAEGSAIDGLVRWVTGYIPSFSRFDLLLAYTSGGVPVSYIDLLLRLFQALAFTFFPLLLAAYLLHRRSL